MLLKTFERFLENQNLTMSLNEAGGERWNIWQVCSVTFCCRLYWGPCREQHTHNKTTDTQPHVLQRVADVHRAFSVWENIWASRKMGCRLERSSHSFLHICCNLIDWNVPVIFLSDRCSLPDKSVFQVSLDWKLGSENLAFLFFMFFFDEENHQNTGSCEFLW